MNLKRIIAAALAGIIALSSVCICAEENTDISESAPIEGEPDNITEQQRVVTNFTMPKNQRATIITPTVDYLIGVSTDDETVREELDVLFNSLSEVGLNSVYINTVYEGKAYYSTI